MKEKYLEIDENTKTGSFKLKDALFIAVGASKPGEYSIVCASGGSPACQHNLVASFVAFASFLKNEYGITNGKLYELLESVDYDIDDHKEIGINLNESVN